MTCDVAPICPPPDAPPVALQLSVYLLFEVQQPTWHSTPRRRHLQISLQTCSSHRPVLWGGLTYQSLPLIPKFVFEVDCYLKYAALRASVIKVDVGVDDLPCDSIIVGDGVDPPACSFCLLLFDAPWVVHRTASKPLCRDDEPSACPSPRRRIDPRQPSYLYRHPCRRRSY